MDSQHAQHFAQHCCLCNRWVRDPTAVRRHLSQAHVEQWKQVASRLEARCAEIKHLLDRDGVCPWCTRVSYSRHFKQCNIVFQCALLGLLHEDGRGDHVGVRRLAAGSIGPAERDNEEAPRAGTERRAAEQTAPTDQKRPKRQRSGFSPTISATLSRSWRLSPFNRKMRSIESDSAAHTRSISNRPDRGQFSSHFTKLDDRGTRRRVRGCRCRPSERWSALLVTETKARPTLFAQDPNAVKAAVERKVMNPSKQFVFQRWNPKEQKLEQDPDRSALGVEQIQQLLQELGTRCKDSII